MINDGSTEPHIEELLKQAEQEDSRFKYIYKPNSGVSDTRNLGIDMAQGEYIVFVDADDYLEPDALRYMLNVAQSRDESIVVFGFCDNDVYNDTTSAITDKVIKETVENILSGFSDLRDLEIDPLLGIDQAGRYSRIFQIEFKNPVVEQ